MPMPHIQRFLQPRARSADEAFSKTVRRNVRAAKKAYRKKGMGTGVTWAVVDVGCSSSHRYLCTGKSPCLTRTRCASGRGHWLLWADRFMNTIEVGALQGFPKAWVSSMVAATSAGAVGKALGDSMSLNVMLRLLPRAALAAGLVKKTCPDFWEDIPATGHLPEAVLKKYEDYAHGCASTSGIRTVAQLQQTVWTCQAGRGCFAGTLGMHCPPSCHLRPLA